MSSHRDRFFNLSSSPSKMFDDLINNDEVPGLAKAQLNPGETGWTPYIDRIFALNNNSQAAISASPTTHNKMTPSKFQPHHQLQQQLALASNLNSSPHKPYSQPVSSIQSTVITNKVLQQPQKAIQEIFLQTPTAEKSFRLSDYLETTPNINSEIMNMLATGGDTTTEKENDPMLFDNFATPSTQRMINKFLKTPDLKRSSISSNRGGTGYTPSVLSTVNLNSFINDSTAIPLPPTSNPTKERSLSVATQSAMPTPSLCNESSNCSTTLNNSLNAAATASPIRVDSLQKKQNNLFKTPLRSVHQQSSPSTIIAESAQKAAAAKSSVELSPTPANKISSIPVQASKPPCKLIKSTSSMEPAIGIFNDKLPPSRPLSSFNQSLMAASNSGNNNGNSKTLTNGTFDFNYTLFCRRIKKK
ncbi:unnamed protein product [Ambrosiozyma monospora]|uniref:Unnamed protein product n=1 Tax=Ambrosiozyma monospora TaxID=43982 RepID=A0ACB5TCT4_AMBMO|nr:unnamed protein product [Ambrosiozyma monospora]